MTQTQQTRDQYEPGDTRFGLADLARVELSPAHAHRLQLAGAESLGPPEWRARKQIEVRDILALSQIGERLSVLALDAKSDLMTIVRLRARVPCLPPGAAGIVLTEVCDLLFRYPEELMHGPIPGHAMVRILKPRHVYLPNVSVQEATPDEPQALCLGANIPRGLPLRESVEWALDYVHRAIADAPHLGSGHGPLNHWVPAFLDGRSAGQEHE